MKPIIITGPTATGKTTISIALAKALGGEVVCADSMQVYAEMSIGTARPTAEEIGDVAHHLFGCVAPDEPFSVALYQQRAFAAIDGILARGKLPVICGGTGLYINSLIYDLDFAKAPGESPLRRQLSAEYDERGADALYARLLELDPASAERIHKNNKVRLVRRLEILLSGSEAKYDFRRRSNRYDFCIYGITKDRERLYQDIDMRVGSMMQRGLLDEAKSIYGKYGSGISAFSAIGYKEFLPYFHGECSLESAVDTVKHNTRKYAKRQLTWFRRLEDVLWVNVGQYACAEEAAHDIINDIMD